MERNRETHASQEPGLDAFIQGEENRGSHGGEISL
jgi:hypothetical protein